MGFFCDENSACHSSLLFLLNRISTIADGACAARACRNHPFRSWILPAEIVRARQERDAHAPSPDGADAVQEN